MTRELDKIRHDLQVSTADPGYIIERKIHTYQEKDKTMDIKEAHTILRAHIAGHYLHQPEEFTNNNLRQLEVSEGDNNLDNGLDILVTLPNFEIIDAHVSFICNDEGVTAAHVSVIYDDVLCDDHTVYYEGEDFYAIILDEIIAISRSF